jgi:hypothetical protein
MYFPLCQPVNVGLNKPFKSHVQKMWFKWLINKGINQGTTSLPMRGKIAIWVYEAMGQMKEERWIIWNAWLKMGFE